jgi:uncharacterized protein
VQKVKSFLAFIFFIGVAGCLPASGAGCSIGAQSAERGDFEKALNEWKSISYDETLKEETRMTMQCLAESGIATSEFQAAAWLQRAAEKNIPDAQAQFSMLLLNGQGVLQNENEAIKWLQKAAGAGLREAQVTLGLLYIYGSERIRNESEAKSWLLRAAEQGDSQAKQAIERLITE